MEQSEGSADECVIIAIVHRARTANELICSFVHCKLQSSLCTAAEMEQLSAG